MLRANRVHWALAGLGHAFETRLVGMRAGRPSRRNSPRPRRGVLWHVRYVGAVRVGIPIPPHRRMSRRLAAPPAFRRIPSQSGSQLSR
jgi:hypothetical protein